MNRFSNNAATWGATALMSLTLLVVAYAATHVHEVVGFFFK